MRRLWICMLSVLVMLSARAAAQETNKFRLRVGSIMTGTEEYEITKTADGCRLAGKLHTQIGDRSMDATHEQTLTPDLTLVRYKLQAGGNQVIEAWREGDQILMRVSASGKEQTKTVPFTPAALVLDNMITAHYQVLLDSIAKSGTASPWTFVVPQALVAISGKISKAGDEPATLNGQSIRVQKYTLQAASLLTEFWAEVETNRLMRVFVPVQDVELVREGFALSPKAKSEPAASAAFVERSVEFLSGSLKFPGTLCLPANAGGKVPVVVMVHGSGPNDRDETIGPNKPFRDLAQGLAAAGIGSLRYDKRTFAFKGKLDVKTLTVEEETIADAVAALQFARTLPEADPKRIFVLGHSQGAMFAPVIAGRAETRGAILMAASERPLDQVIAEQLAFQLKLAGMSDQEITAKLDELKKSFARVRSGEAKEDEVVFYAPVHYWRDFLSRDPQAALKNLKAPVLVLQGGKDIQVPKVDYDLALQALASKPPEMREAHFFPNLSHLFLPVEGQPTGAEYGIEAHIPQEVIQTIASWVMKQGGAVNPGK